MRRLSLATLAVALLVALVPTSANAKGPIEALLEGPGLESPVLFAWSYEGTAADPRRAPIEHIALATGLMTAVLAGASLESFDAAARRLRAAKPEGDLGPKYTLTYRFEGPGGGEELVQAVYPFAEPRPVTYIAPDRIVRRPGSWYVADESLEQELVRLGLPSVTSSRWDGFLWAAAVLVAGTGIALAIAGLTVAASRRRPRHA